MLLKHGYQSVEYFLAVSIEIKDIAHYGAQRFVWKFLQIVKKCVINYVVTDLSS